MTASRDISPSCAAPSLSGLVLRTLARAHLPRASVLTLLSAQGAAGGGFGRVQSMQSLASPATSGEPTPGAAHDPLRVLGKTGSVRNWLRVGANGEATQIQLDKHGIAARCGVPLRDLRVLEPGLTTSCAPSNLLASPLRAAQGCPAGRRRRRGRRARG